MSSTTGTRISHYLELQLRVLYSFNSDNQLILAKSTSLTPVVPLQSPIPSTSSSKYATVAFKTCLQTLTRCSPEILQGHDYAVYVHDPLESSTGSVAVGMGLLSTALFSPEGNTTTVTGTIVKGHDGVEALEIRLGLRGIIPAPPPSQPASAVSQTQTAPNIPEQEVTAPAHNARPRKRVTASRSQSSITDQESSSLKASRNSSRSRKGKGRAVPPPTPTPTPVPQPATNGQANATTIQLLSALSQGLPSTSLNNAQLILALSQLDASSGPRPDGMSFTQLISQLVVPKQPVNPATTIAESSSSTPDASQRSSAQSSPDGKAAAGGKENVSPKLTIRIKPLKDPGKSSSPPRQDQSSLDENTPTISSSQSQSSANSHPALTSSTSRVPASPSPSTSVLRRRSRNDVLGNSPRRNAARPFSNTSTRFPTSGSSLTFFQSAQVPQSSPPRIASTSRLASERLPASSPLRPPPRKKYVVPEWARTGTSMQPRYPENVAKAKEDREQFEKEERHRTKIQRDRDRRANKRGTQSTASKESLEPSKRRARPSESASVSVQQFVTASAGPIVASASADVSFPFHSRSVSPPPTQTPANPPKTPPRKRRATVSTPGETPLFTPTPRGSGLVLLGSPSSPTRSPVRKRTRFSDDREPGPAFQLAPDDGEDDEDWLASEMEITTFAAASDADEPPSSSVPQSSAPSAPQSENEDDTERCSSPLATQEYWPGLPPSSPIAASSPVLGGEDLPPSDAEMDDGGEASDFPQASQESTESDLSNFNPEDLASLMAMNSQDPFSVTSPTFGDDPFDFDAFMRVPATASTGDSQIDSVLQTGLADFDYTELFASLGQVPTAGDSSQPVDGSGLGTSIDGQNLNLSFDDVHALFSGCVM